MGVFSYSFWRILVLTILFLNSFWLLFLASSDSTTRSPSTVSSWWRFKNKPTFTTIDLSTPSSVPLELPTAAWLFNAVHNTLRILGNSVARNGFSFVAGHVPAGTLLYHGKIGSEPPAPGTMEWLAFDAEYSMVMVSGPFRDKSKSHFLTYVSTAPLKILNVDGASASLAPLGTMDSQGFVLNQPKPDWERFTEYERANLLCEFGKDYGVDGYVRLNTGFELIMCDFGNPKIKLVSNVNIVTDYDDGFISDEKNNTESVTAQNILDLAESRLNSASASQQFQQQSDSKTSFQTSEEHRRRRRQFTPEQARHSADNKWAWVKAGVSRYNGDARIIPDFRGFVSLYGRPEHYNLTGPVYTHRLLDAPPALRDEVRADLSAVLSVDFLNTNLDGINWQTVTDDITARFAPTLLLLNQTLGNLVAQISGSTTLSEKEMIEVRLAKTRVVRETATLLRQFTQQTAGEPGHGLAACRAFWDPAQYLSDEYTSNNLERRIQEALHVTTDALCGIVFDVFDWATPSPLVDFPEASYNNGNITSGNSTYSIFSEVVYYSHRFKDLIELLGWTEFMGCGPEACGVDEKCYFPMWPSSTVTEEDYAIGMRCVSAETL